MNDVRKLLTVFGTALVATGAWVSAASAQTLELTNEATGANCPAVVKTGTSVSGGCLVHAQSEGGVTLKKHTFGIESTITVCATEGHGRVDSDGEGYTAEQVLSGASCTRQPCKDVSGEAIPWPVVVSEGTPSGSTGTDTEFGTTTFCVEPAGGGTDESCEIDIVGHGILASHTGEAGDPVESSAHLFSAFRCEIVGHGLSEVGGTHDGVNEVKVEVTHLD